jgi:TonB family protein
MFDRIVVYSKSKISTMAVLNCVNFVRPNLSAIFLFIVLFSGNLSAQERKEIINKTGGKYSTYYKEDYYVLTSDMTTKDGPYQLFRGDNLLESGYYKNGKKDSVWEVRQRSGHVLSQKTYSQGKPTGIWHFNDGMGTEEWNYDFSTNKASWQIAPWRSSVYYPSDSGAWIEAHLDTPLLALRGNAEWLNFLNRTLRYPDEAVDKMQMGTAIVSITVDEEGKILEYGIGQTSGYPSLDKEALRVVKLFDWEFIPAQKDGKKIKAQYRQPLVFRLEVNK